MIDTLFNHIMLPIPPKPHTYIVSVSGGLGSAEVLRRAIEKYGRENVVAVFCDVKGYGRHAWSDFPAVDELLHERFGGESRDTYRFLWQLSHALDIPITRLEDGRSIWDVFVEKKALRLVMGRTFFCPASEALKRAVFKKYLLDNHAPGTFTILLGMGWDEEHRVQNARGYWSNALGYPVSVVSLLQEKPYASNHSNAAWCKSQGIDVPSAYTIGFEHNNCGGGCVQAGQAHFAKLYFARRDVYAYWRYMETSVNRAIGKSYTILKEESGGKTKRMSLIDFQARIQRGKYDKYDFGACGCFTNGQPALPGMEAA